MKATISFLSICIFVFGAYGQQSATNLTYPESGKPMPTFIMKNIKYFSKNQATGSDFRGKWLILDFWSKYCSSCVASFPRMNEIQKEVGDRMQIMLVGIEDPEGEIEHMYAKFRQKENLAIPCDFDSLLAKRFDIAVVPHLIILDANGIVQAVTNHLEVNDAKAFLAGQHPILAKTYYMMHDDRFDKLSFDNRKPFLVDNNGGADSDFIFRSLLSQWTPKQKRVVPRKIELNSVDSTYRKGSFQIIGASVDMLYNYAFYGVSKWNVSDTEYFGKYQHTPILEIRDSSLFKYSGLDGRNMFCYSLIIPHHLATADRMKSYMQKDLSEYFGFDAGIQVRECSYWKLVSSPAANESLKTKGGPETAASVIRHAGFSVKNITVSRLIYFLETGYGNDLFISDETGMKYNIDIALDCIMTNLQDIRRALQDNGMDLIESKRPMKVLVIRDKKASPPGTE